MAQRLRAPSWKKIWAQFPASTWQPTNDYYSSINGSDCVHPLWAPEPCVMHSHTFEKNTHKHKILKHFKGFLVKEGGMCIWVLVCTRTHVSVCGCVHVRSERALGPLKLALQVVVNAQLMCSKLQRVFFVASWAPCGESMVELCHQATMSYVHLSLNKEDWQAMLELSTCQGLQSSLKHKF